jgi:hypothetical protein
MNATESEHVKRENLIPSKSMLNNESVMRETELLKRENKILAASRGAPIVVSEKQFETVRLEQLTSLNLLNSSGDVLLSAMNSMVPPADSGRTVGEYTAQGIRQIAKSLCDIVMTKSHVVRQMYAISRDEH